MTREIMLVGVAAAALAGPALAAAGETESFWIPLAGDFDDPASWTGPVPDETVTAIFDLHEDVGPFIRFNADELSSRAIIRAGAVTFLLFDTIKDGHSLHYDLMNPSFNTPSFIIAENPGDEASLRIDFGFLSTRSMVLGMGAGSIGAIDFAVGLFDLTAGLDCEFQLHVGGAGQGLLTIDQGVIVTTDEAVLGVATGSLGEIIVTNPGSSLDALGPLTVGRQGQGILTISDLADVVSAEALIGQQTGSIGDVTLTGQGARWTINGSLDVGFQGDGSLTITGGAAVFTHGFAAIGTLPEPVFEPTTGGVGNVSIDGPASLWLVDGDLFVGLLWLGTLDISGGATVTSQSGIIGLAAEPGTMASVEGPGSVWSNIDGLTVLGDSLLRVADGALVIAQPVDVMTNAELTGDGAILGDVGSDGTVRVGDPIGTLTVHGSFTTNGEFVVDLAGPGDFDTVSVNGNALVAGGLAVSLAGAYEPRLGDSFPILTADAVSGTFSSVSLPGLDPVLAWHVGYEADAVVLLVTPIGDFDGDGIVGISDFLIVIGNWGPCSLPCPPCPGDADGDCEVGIQDFLVVLGNWTL